MAGCTGVTSRAVVAVEVQGCTIHTVMPAAFPVSITVHTSVVWVRLTPSIHRLSRHSTFSRPRPRPRPPRCPTSTSATRTPYTGERCFPLFLSCVYIIVPEALRRSGETGLSSAITSDGCMRVTWLLNAAYREIMRTFSRRYDDPLICAT